jgi:CheY-like chemotaxis protein
MLSFDLNLKRHPSDQRWDAFIASLHRVWEYAPDVSLDGQLRLSGSRVLIHDQQPARRACLAEQLVRVGLAATSAGSAEETRMQLEDHHQELLLMVVDGENQEDLQLCQEIADAGYSKLQAIIAIGTTTDRDSIWRWRRAGARYFLTDPYDPYVLLTLMTSAIAID